MSHMSTETAHARCIGGHSPCSALEMGSSKIDSDALARDTLALTLAGGNGTRLGELTRWHCKPAISFGGHFRNIDFTLSNCVNSQVRRIAVLTQYKAQSLIDHI